MGVFQENITLVTLFLCFNQSLVFLLNPSDFPVAIFPSNWSINSNTLLLGYIRACVCHRHQISYRMREIYYIYSVLKYWVLTNSTHTIQRYTYGNVSESIGNKSVRLTLLWLTKRICMFIGKWKLQVLCFRLCGCNVWYVVNCHFYGIAKFCVWHLVCKCSHRE